MSGWWLLAALGGLAWFWTDSLASRERVRERCLGVCRERGLQLLDDTVALKRLRLRRDDAGRVCIERSYVFEFSDSGERRLPGWVRTLGGRVGRVHLMLPDGPATQDH